MRNKENHSDKEVARRDQMIWRNGTALSRFGLILGISLTFLPGLGFNSCIAQTIVDASRCARWQPDLARPQLPDAVDECRAAVLANTRVRGDASVFFGNLAAVEIVDKRYQDAVSDLNTSLELNADNIDALNNRATANARLGNVEAAISDYKSIIRLHPHTVEEYMSEGVAYSHLSMPREAVSMLTEAIKRSAQGREKDLALMDRAIAYQALNEYGLAIDDFSNALLASPQDGKILSDRCFARAISGIDLKLALDDCEATQQGNTYDRPPLFESMVRTGFVLIKMEQYPEALMHLGAAVSLAPKSAAALYLSGYANNRLGKQEEGGAEIARAKGINPNIADVYGRLGLSP